MVVEESSIMVQRERIFNVTSGDVLAEDLDRAAMDDESALAAVLASPHSRMVGGTEFSWCRAVSSGTGITTLGLLFSRALDPSALQLAIDRLQIRHPRLRSRLGWIQGRPAFCVSTVPVVKLQVLNGFEKYADPASGDRSAKNGEVPFSYESADYITDFVEVVAEGRKSDRCVSMKGDDEYWVKEIGDDKIEPGGRVQDQWLRLVELELNTNDWEEQYCCLDPRPMFVVRLYNLGVARSVLVLRLHSAICDRASAATILKELLPDFKETPHDFSETGHDGVSPADECTAEECGMRALVAIEDAIPLGKANKPFWAHGLDIVGYSLGSRRHACLPFNDAQHQPRRSEIVCHTLSVQHTQLLLQICSAQRCSKLGALSAAGLKATASLKQLGSRIEHFAVVTFIDCRSELDPALSDSTVGFYHSAILNTHAVNEGVEFWELARRCDSSVENALRSRKHFTDMGDVNFLMCQAIQFPQLTPAASLRTSLMALFQKPLFDDMQEVKQAAGIEDYVGCSSIHGVGPSIAIYDSIQQGALRSTCVYPSPLHSRVQMTAFVDAMMGYIVCACQ